MEKNFQIKIASSAEDLDKVFEVREKVFIVEQKVDREEEFDEFEDVSRHLLAIDSEGRGIGCSRWRETKSGVKLERFAVLEEWRSFGVGSALVANTIDDIRLKVKKGTHLYLHAQITAVHLYEKFEFKKKGSQFVECDIVHFLMEREL